MIPVPRYTVTERFVVRLVALLPTSTDPDYRVRCLAPPVGIGRRMARQLVPRRGGQDCCWYHGGDWHTASRSAIHQVRRLRREGVTDTDEISHQATERARAVHGDGWEFEAIKTLLMDPIMLGEGDEGTYVNGRHRTQAMLDAGVRHTLTLTEKITFH